MDDKNRKKIIWALREICLLFPIKESTHGSKSIYAPRSIYIIRELVPLLRTAASGAGVWLRKRVALGSRCDEVIAVPNVQRGVR